MTPTAAEVLETAMALSPDERVDVATRLLRSAGTEDAAQLQRLREDIAAGIAQLDDREGVAVPVEELHDQLVALGREAAERTVRKPSRATE